MDLNKMVEALKSHSKRQEVGMIACHLGVVRGTSRGGEKVRKIEVRYDHDAIEKIIEDAKRLPGIVDVLVDYREGALDIGDEILAVAVAGDLRENVFPALVKTVDRIKTEATKKKESLH